MLDADFALERPALLLSKQTYYPIRRDFPLATGWMSSPQFWRLPYCAQRSVKQFAAITWRISKNLQELPEKDLINCGNRAFIHDKRVRNFG